MSLISLISYFMVPPDIPCETKGSETEDGETEAGETRVKTNRYPLFNRVLGFSNFLVWFPVTKRP